MTKTFNLREWLGFCKHEWLDTKETVQSEYLIKRILICRKCGILKSKRIW